MAKKIEKLTSDQDALLVRFRAEMWARGTSCIPTDRSMAETAINEAYAIVNLPSPKIFWMPSPMTSAIALCVLKKVADDVNLQAGLGDS